MKIILKRMPKRKPIYLKEIIPKSDEDKIHNIFNYFQNQRLNNIMNL